MKKLLLSLLLFPVIASAQESQPLLPKPTQQHHEIGINLFSINNADLYFRDGLRFNANYNFVPGLYYNYHFGKNALRATLNYSQKVEFYKSTGIPEVYVDRHSFTRTAEIRIGYQREFGNGKLRPYVYGDLVFGFSKMDGWGYGCGCFGCFEGPISTTEMWGGVAAGGGLRYQATQHLAFTLETGVIFTANRYTSDGGFYVPGQQDYLKFGTSPVSRLGLSFTF